MKKESLTINQLRAVANGKGDSFVGMEGGGLQIAYTGENDDLVDMEIGGTAALVDEHNNRRVLVVTLKNTDTQTRVAKISPGLVYDLNDTTIMRDGAFRHDGASLGDPQHLIGEGSPVPIRKMLAYMQKNPQYFQGFRIKTSDPAQFDKILTLKRDDIFTGNPGTEEIHLSRYESEQQFNDRLLTVNRGFQLDGETEMFFPIPGGATTTITLYAAGALNTARAFAKKIGKAKVGIGVQGRGKLKTEKFVSQSSHQLGNA